MLRGRNLLAEQASSAAHIVVLGGYPACVAAASADGLGTVEALKECCASNLGMAIVPEASIAMALVRFHGAAVAPPTFAHAALIEHRNKPNEPHLKSFAIALARIANGRSNRVQGRTRVDATSRLTRPHEGALLPCGSRSSRATRERRQGGGRRGRT